MEEFPPPSVLDETVREVLKQFISRNSLRQTHSAVANVLGEESKNIFDSSIMYRPFSTVDRALVMLVGSSPVTQIIGKVLNDAEVFQIKLNDLNCIVKDGAHKDTHVNVIPMMNEDLQSIVVAELRMAKGQKSAAIQRYLRAINTGEQVYFDTHNDRYDAIKWRIQVSTGTAEGLDTVIERLDAALTVYYKLLTRMPTCQSFSNALPRFQNTLIQEQDH